MKGAQPFVFGDHVEAKRYAPATERNREAISEVPANNLSIIYRAVK